MIKINLIVVGKIKEKYFTDAIGEYQKRMSRFANFNVIELKDFPTPNNASESENASILENEGQEILDKIENNDFIIAMTIEGKLVSSEDLAKTFSDLAVEGYSTVDVIIGGSLGLSQAVKNRANLKISLGRITLPHQLARVVVSEQIYRAFMINAGSPYHK
ncbi:MAG: 23S rRNA (pseudouridine(1915)-N(3))-methyltransferase RlmH [Lactobacillaceae bacterium]|jgi:23S rRNA (pseudouridine1915-N3)-methyltransferase|nr:23S rRNA (pseudouridine(1915)-N(3))-methyltransferase RlmH [Lactobacillaceae bacterium]